MARTTDNGYGWEHQKLRESQRPAVEAGEVDCWRCGRRILPGQPWDLGHKDGTGKAEYAGPEHRKCNREAGMAMLTPLRLASRRASRFVHVPADEI